LGMGTLADLALAASITLTSAIALAPTAGVDATALGVVTLGDDRGLCLHGTRDRLNVAGHTAGPNGAGVNSAALGHRTVRDVQPLRLETASSALRSAGDGLLRSRTAAGARGSAGGYADDAAGVLGSEGVLRADRAAGVDAAALAGSAAGELAGLATGVDAATGRERSAGDRAGGAAGVNAAAVRDGTTRDRARGATGMDSAAVRDGTAGDRARGAAGLDAAADGMPATGDAEAGLAAGVNAAASRLASTGDDGEAGLRSVDGRAAEDADRRRGDVDRGSTPGRTAAAGVDAAADRGTAGGGRAAATEILGQGALHELGEWIHDSSPLRKSVPKGEEE